MKATIDFTKKQMSDITGYSITTITEKIKILGIKPNDHRKRTYFYSDLDFKKIVFALQINQKQITKYYPIKTTETFFIYESKINKK